MKKVGPYRLETRLARGGQGEVWLGRGSIGRVAIKLLRPRDVVESRERFEREIATLKQLASVHAPRVLDSGIQGDLLFYAMEYLEGLDLQTLVDRHGPQPAGRVVEILAQVTRALAEAHEKGIVHRDIKPANVMLTQREQRDHVVVIDYGLAGGLGCDLDAGLPTGKALRGTPAYLPPEAITSECEGECFVDGRADIYSLGCLGYWLLSGALAIDGTDAQDVAINHVFARPRDFAAQLAVPNSLARLIFECLEKDPTQRPSATSLLHTLTQLEGGWSVRDARDWWQTHQ